MAGLFHSWQSEYEAAGIAVFPADAAKKIPSVSNYLKAGIPAARVWAQKYPDKEALGFAPGQRSGVVVLDLDEPGERIIAEAFDQFGPSPVVVQTASGKHHAWYRWNGERRKIGKVMPGRKADILGGGFVLAPPSRTAAGQYRFIQGSLDDVRSLPKLRSILPPVESVDLGRDATNEPVPVGRRNDDLFRVLMQAAKLTATLDELITSAAAFNRSYAEPLPDDEVVRTAHNVWNKTQSGDNWFGSRGLVAVARVDLHELQLLGPDCLALAMHLRANHAGLRLNFFVADSMAHAMPGGAWSRKRLSAARSSLVASGELVKVRAASSITGPAIFRFGKIALGGEWGGQQGGRVG